MRDAAGAVRALEEVIEFGFGDAGLATTALRPDVKGFSRLEFIGDAVLGAAVASTLQRSLRSPSDFAEIISNRHLDEVYDRELVDLAPGRSGDVVEAVIGAVHLDGGFDAAAAVALRFSMPGVSWVAIPEKALGRCPDVDNRELRILAFAGSTVLNAVAAHQLVTTLVSEPHRVLAQTRSRMLAPKRLLRLPAVRAEVPGSQGIGLESGYDRLQAVASSAFQSHGWTPTLGWLSALLDFDQVEPDRTRRRQQAPRRTPVAGSLRDQSQSRTQGDHRR